MILSTVSSLGMVSFAEDNTKNISVDKDEEEFLAQAKAVAIAEINTFKSAANAAIAEKAIEDIDNAETVADVSAIHQKALHDMSAADETAAVNTAKETAISDIINAAKTDINNAESIYEIGNIIYDAFDAVKFAGEVEISLNLIDKIYADGISGDEIFDEIYESGVEAIENAETSEELDDAYFTTVFDLSKRYYVVVLENLKADSVTDAAKTIVENAIESINDKHNTEEVNNVKDKAVEAIKTQKEAEQPEHEDPSKTCKHMCHKSGFMGFIWKIVRFFCKLFGTNKTCSCGAAHY